MSDEQTPQPEQPLTKKERKALKKQQKMEKRMNAEKSNNAKAAVWWVIGVLAVFGIIWWAASVSTSAPAGIVSSEAALSVTDADWVQGPANAPVTIVEFSDFQCPACAAYEPLIKQTLVEFGDSVRFVYKHFPLVTVHPNAEEAAWAAEAAGNQGKFWEMHDLLFDRQSDWANLRNPEEQFTTYAENMELDSAQFAADYGASAIHEKVSTQRTGGLALGITGTPTFYINNKKVENPSGLEEFSALIKQALAAAPAVAPSEGETIDN